jgi:hypothetical protein
VRYVGEPVPVTLAVVLQFPTTPGGPNVTCEHKLASMRVELGDGGRYTLTTGRVIACDDGRPDDRSSVTETGSYTVNADTVHMTAELSPDETAAGVAREYSATRTPLELRMYSRYTAYGLAFSTVDYRPLLFQAAR